MSICTHTYARINKPINKLINKYIHNVRKFGGLDISQTSGPPRLVTGIALHYVRVCIYVYIM
jgi:hypothetical protein